jgi:hypothetical protein
MNEKLSLPPSLDAVADHWRQYIDQSVVLRVTHDFSRHIEGTYSIYHITFTFVKDEPLVVHYAGMTQNPTTRRDQHKSELKRCKSTTRTGKSKLYCSKYFEGVSQVDMHFNVIDSGFFTLDQVKNAEKALSDELTRLYGKEAVLTSPRKNTEPKEPKAPKVKCSSSSPSDCSVQSHRATQSSVATA